MEVGKFTFEFSWPVTMKALWHKYPCPELSFVKEHRVISVEPVGEDKLIVKKLMYCNKFKFLKTLTFEELHFDFRNQTLVTHTKFLKPSGFWSKEGIEEMRYNGEQDRTLCAKIIHGGKGFYDKFFSSFKQGCEVVEKKARNFIEKSTK